MIPPDSVGPLVQVNGNALVVQWLAVVTADCKQPDAFCVTMENNELGFFLTDLGCIPPVFPCYCSDYDAIANVTASPMVLGPGTYSVTVGCDFSLAPYYCGEPEVFAVIVEE
jgi:hypothetical protein